MISSPGCVPRLKYPKSTPSFEKSGVLGKVKTVGAAPSMLRERVSACAAAGIAKAARRARVKEVKRIEGPFEPCDRGDNNFLSKAHLLRNKTKHRFGQIHRVGYKEI